MITKSWTSGISLGRREILQIARFAKKFTVRIDHDESESTCSVKRAPAKHNKIYRLRNRRTLNRGSLNLAWLGRNPEGNAASSVGVVLWGVVSSGPKTTNI